MCLGHPLKSSDFRLSQISFLTTIAPWGCESSLVSSGHLARASHAAQLNMSCQAAGYTSVPLHLPNRALRGNRPASRH